MTKLVLYLSIISLMISCKKEAQVVPIAQKGVIDLRNWDFDKDDPIKLNGEWEFYWSKILYPKDFKKKNYRKNYLKFPLAWSGSKQGNKPLAGHGFGTYRLKIKHSGKTRDFSLLIKDPGTAYNIFINGKKIFQSGKVGKSKKEHIPHRGTPTITFLSNKKEIELVMQISNFSITNGGPWAEFVLDKRERGVLHQIYNAVLDSFILGVLLIMGLYHITIFIFYRKNIAALIFAAFCLGLTLRVGVNTDAKIFYILFPNLPYELNWKFEYIGMYIPIVSLGFFMRNLFPKDFPKWTAIWVASYSLLAFIVTLFGTVELYSGIPLTFFQLCLLISAIISVYCIIKAIIKKRDGILILSSGILIVIITNINDVLYYAGLIETVQLVHMGSIIFIFSQATLLSDRFSRAFIQTEKSKTEITLLNQKLKKKNAQVTAMNEKLEEKVEEKTRDIKSILKYIKQGILTVYDARDKKIGQDYSDFLEEILGEAELENKCFEDIFINRIDDRNDFKSQISSFFSISLSEDLVTFKMNKHLLPNECVLESKSGKKKIIEVDWSPISNKDNIVEKILISMRDVTENRKLEIENRKHREELELIDEILGVSEDYFQRLVDTSHDFLKQNIELIDMNKDMDPEVIKIMFINIHTLKGITRSYHFTKLTEVLHNIEHSYSLIQKRQKDWNQEELQKDLHDLTQVLNEYININNIKLGRKNSLGEIKLKASTIEMMVNFINNSRLSKEEKTNYKPLFFDIYRLYYQDLKDTLKEAIQSLPALAKDLKKEVPTVEISESNILLNKEGADVLKNIFIHIIRNTMDHGLEPKEEREQAKKTIKGNINIYSEWKGEYFEIYYYDDGRGLDLKKIKSLGIARGLFTENTSPSKEKIANLILQSGFTTTKKVSQISGRGIGMDAVKNYIENIGGNLKIELGEETIDTGRTPFKLRISLPDKYILNSNILS